jgi:sigma-B regulation protein RsbU (phosphoserine phosphatase)
MIEFTILPRLPGLLAAGSHWYALFLAVSALMSRRLLRQHGLVTRHEPEQLALASLAWAFAHLPAMFDRWMDTPVQAWFFALVLCIAATMPASTDRSRTLVGRGLVLAAAGSLTLWGTTMAPLLAGSAAAGLYALMTREFARHILLGLAALFLFEAISPSIANILEIILFGLVSLWLWRKAGIDQRASRLLMTSMVTLPILLAAAGQVMVKTEAAFRQEQVSAAHLRLELIKTRVESLTSHAHDLLKIAAADPIITTAIRAKQDDHTFALRILNRRVGADAIFLIDTRGRILNTSDGGLRGFDVSFRPYFTHALAGNANAYFAKSLTRNYAASYFARPILDDAAETVAVLVLRFNLETQLADYLRTDDVMIHRNGVILIGSGQHKGGALFRDEGTADAVLKERLFSQQDLEHLGYERSHDNWLRHASGSYSMWASLPLPGGIWEAGKLISMQALTKYRDNQMYLVMAMLAILLLLGLHYCNSNALLHLLLLENEARSSAELAERTARIQTEESDSRKSAILAAGLDCFITVDDSGRIIDFNRAAEESFGYRADEAHGRLLSDIIIPPELRSAHEKGMAHWRRTGEGPVLHQRIEINAMRRSGEIFPVELAIVPFGSGNRHFFAGFIRDITERRHLESERERITQLLRQSVAELEYQKFALDQHAIVSISDAAGAIIYANDKYSEISGYSRAELLGSTHRIVRSGMQDAAFYRELWKTISEGKTWHGELANRNKNGEIFWVASTIVPWLDESGKPYQYVSIYTDITAQKQVEHALAEARRRELETGSEIQRSLLLGDLPEGIHGACLATYTESSQGIDGDFFAVTRFRPDCFELLVGDVMGKGVPAAMIGAGVKSSYNKVLAELFAQRADEHQLPTPSEIINALHRSLTLRLIELSSFVTLALYRFDLTAETLCVVNAGHTPGLLKRSGAGGVERILGDNLPIGVIEDEIYTQQSLAVAPGDALLIYSDGITESFNGLSEDFGLARLCTILDAGRAVSLPPSSLLQSMRQQVRNFVGSDVLDDDQTAIMVEVLPGRTPPRGSIEQRTNPCLLILPWRLDALGALRTRIAETAGHLADDEVQAVILASFEAATNILRHAEPYFSDATIACRLTRSADEYSVELIYPGPDFSPPDDPQPDFSGNSEGGFGLYIINNCVDAVEYASPMPGVSSIRLIKRTARERGAFISS